METRYFPHLAGGSGNKKTDGTIETVFNIKPNNPIAVDPRLVISEWTKEALLTLSYKDVYVGLQIYSIADKTNMICRWTPGPADKFKFSAYDCIWEELHNGNKSNDWVNVLNYVHEKTIEEQIDEANKKIWRYKIDYEQGYYGFFEFKNEFWRKDEIGEGELYDEEVLNRCLNEILLTVDESNTLSGSLDDFWLSRAGSNKRIALSSSAEKREYVGKYFIIFIPKNAGYISSIRYNGTDYVTNILAYDRALECIKLESNPTSYKLNEVPYLAYGVPVAYDGLDIPEIYVNLTKI